MDVEEEEEYEYEDDYPEDVDEDYRFQDEDEPTKTTDSTDDSYADSKDTEAMIIDNSAGTGSKHCSPEKGGPDLEAKPSPGGGPLRSVASTGSSASKQANSNYQSPSASDGAYVLTEYALVYPLLQKLISEVCGLLDISEDVAQILLQMFKWDKEKLIDQFFSNSEKVLDESGMSLFSPEILASLEAQRLAPKYIPAAGPRSGGSATASASFCCRICFDDSCDLVEQGVCVGCGHIFCRDCFAEYVRTQILDGPSCILMRCPQHKCREKLSFNFVRLILLGPGGQANSALSASGSYGAPATAAIPSNGDIFDKYLMYLTRNFIETSRTMKYCPSPNCNKVAIIGNYGIRQTIIRCSCTHPFCFRCGEEAHDPVSCQQLGDWQQKCVSESETANWILANTKKCPNCNTRIEKNQGCNHMSCKLCKKEFCWICMGAWSDHNQATGGFYKCNRYDSSALSTNSESTAAQRAKAELDRYLHYYQRYHGHDRALKFASTQREMAEIRMAEKQETDKSSWMDVQFLKQAAEQVIECRRVLKYTYALGFFLKDETPEKSLFEHHQEMLEKNTERLHEHTEQPLDEMDRTQIVNLTRVTEKFLASLLNSIVNGVVTLPSGLNDGSGDAGDVQDSKRVRSAESRSNSVGAAGDALTPMDEAPSTNSSSGGGGGGGGGGGLLTSSPLVAISNLWRRGSGSSNSDPSGQDHK